MEIAADEAKVALNTVGENLSDRKKLEQSRVIENRLQNLCIEIQAGEFGVLDFLKSQVTILEKDVIKLNYIYILI